jgi:hypothetical protein
MSSRKRVLAGVELASPRQRDFHLLHCRALEQRVDLALGPMIFGCCRLRESSEQGHDDNYVLASPGKVREITAILDDPLVYVAGDGTRTPTISVALNLVLEL